MVTIFGHEHFKKPWRIWSVDFSSLGNDCNRDEDYENWEYASCDTNNVLGMSLSIKRRKPQLTCFNGREFNRTVHRSNCEQCKITVSLPTELLSKRCTRKYVNSIQVRLRLYYFIVAINIVNYNLRY